MTSKPISTISYNTLPFLKEKLNDWIDQHLIQSYAYIFHKGEDGDKDHIHLRIVPNKSLDPMNLSEDLREYELGKDKPLGVRDWRPSKEEDWILYVVHDPDYMKIKYSDLEKGEKLPYEWKDIVAPDYYDVEIAYIRAKAKLKHTASNLTSRMSAGESAIDMIKNGENIFTVNAVMRVLSQGDYQRLQKEFKKSQGIVYQLTNFIEGLGYMIEYDDSGQINAFVGKQSELPKMYDVDIKGLMDDPYCPVCGKALNENHIDKNCPLCNAVLNWERYKKLIKS